MLNLVIHDLIKRTAFIEKSVEFDNIRILCRRSDHLVRHDEMGEIKTDRSTVLVGSSVKTKHDHSWLAYSRVGRHGGCMSDEAVTSAKYMGDQLCTPHWRAIKQGGNARWMDTG